MTQEEIQTLRDSIAETNPDALFAEGFDEAIIGMMVRFDIGPVVLYDYEKIIQALMTSMTDVEAVEYFNYNMLGAWHGENTPAFYYRTDEAFFHAKEPESK